MTALPRSYVLDASVLIKVLVPEADSAQAHGHRVLRLADAATAGP